MSVSTVEPLSGPLDAEVVVPGSKSLTNRALVAAALAEGDSELVGALRADDTDAMATALSALGARVDFHDAERVARVTGTAGALRPGPVDLDARLSGTTARFVLPVLALGRGRYRLDGAPSLRARPMGPAVDALRELGAEVHEEGEPGRLPVSVVASGLLGGRVRVPGDASSQFASGLLLAGPRMRDGVVVEATGEVVSRPYLAMTVSTMAAFDIAVDVDAGQDSYRVRPGAYRATRYRVEPDATAASYFFAAAAIAGGRVLVRGLAPDALQGDVAFVDVLASMGARVSRGVDGIEVVGTGTLHGIDVDLADLSDTAQTLAAVAVFADSPTRVRGVGFIRGKETDRVAAVVRELRRCGIDAREEPDGFVVHPGTPKPTRVETYDDHRMAMSFALLGLRVPGIEIADPDCVAKTFPGYWDTLAGLRAGGIVDAG